MNYQITGKIQHGTLKTTGKPVFGLDFKAQLIPESSIYLYPDTIMVQVGERELQPEEYTYDSTTGEIVIPGKIVSADVVITAVLEENVNLYGATFTQGGLIYQVKKVSTRKAKSGKTAKGASTEGIHTMQ